MNSRQVFDPENPDYESQYRGPQPAVLDLNEPTAEASSIRVSIKNAIKVEKDGKLCYQIQVRLPINQSLEQPKEYKVLKSVGELVEIVQYVLENHAEETGTKKESRKIKMHLEGVQDRIDSLGTNRS